MIPDEDLVLHRGTRNPLLPFDHWLRAFDGHTSRRDGLETSFVAMIPLYRRVIETQDICMLTRDRFDDKRTQSPYRISLLFLLFDESLHIFTRYLLFFKTFVLLFFFFEMQKKKDIIIELHLYESVREQIVYRRQFHEIFSLIIN